MVGVEIKLAESRSGPPTGMALNLEVQGEDFNLLSKSVEKIKQKFTQVMFLFQKLLPKKLITPWQL